MYKYIHTCIYIHISCPHTSTHTHIYTHAYKMYTWTHAKHVWNDGAAATAREAPAWRQEALPFSLSATIRRGIPFVDSTPIACPRETTDKRRTTTTNSSLSHHHDSAPSRLHSLICTGAEPIHPVHASSQLGRAAVASRNEVMFLPFWRAYIQTYIHICVCMCIYICTYLYIACMCSLIHLALGNEDGGVQLVYESACWLAWGVILDRRKDRGVVCVFSIFNAGGRVCVCVCVYTRTHTNAAQMGCLDVSPGVGTRHLEDPTNPDGPNLCIHIFVYVYKVHVCIFMLRGGMRSWKNSFFF